MKIINNNNKNKHSCTLQTCKNNESRILVLGPLLAKYKKAKISLPGGCAIGTRPVDLHLMVLKRLGARIK